MEDKYEVYEKLNEIIASMDSSLDEAICNGNESKLATKKKNGTAQKIILGIVVAICIVVATIFIKVVIPMMEYNKAQNAMETGNYNGALDTFRSLGDYKDSKSKIYEVEKAMISNAKVGDVIKYGDYEQDSDDGNGEEPIEWIVIDKKGDELLLLSNNILDFVPISYEGDVQSWKTSQVRKAFLECYIPASFFNIRISEFFTTDEMSVIVEKEIETNKYYEDLNTEQSWYGSDPVGSLSTQDKLFLLSYEEVEKYRKVNKKWMQAEYTPESINGERNLTNENERHCWWTRTNLKMVYDKSSGGRDANIYLVKPFCGVNSSIQMFVKRIQSSLTLAFYKMSAACYRWRQT